MLKSYKGKNNIMGVEGWSKPQQAKRQRKDWQCSVISHFTITCTNNLPFQLDPFLPPANSGKAGCRPAFVSPFPTPSRSGRAYTTWLRWSVYHMMLPAKHLLSTWEVWKLYALTVTFPGAELVILNQRWSFLLLKSNNCICFHYFKSVCLNISVHCSILSIGELSIMV